MSLSIEAQAGQEAHVLVDRAEQVLQKAVAEHGTRAPFSYPNTAYYLPLALGYFAKPVEKIGDLPLVMQQARNLLAEADARPGLAALFAAETLEILRPLGQPFIANGEVPPASIRFTSPISDAQVRTWGVQLSDGRIPGIALILGSAKNCAAAVSIIQELRQRNILCMLSGTAQGRSLTDQLQKDGIQMGTAAGILPLGADASSAVHAFGFVARCSMKLGGHKPGAWSDILQYGKQHVPGFVLVLGATDETERALALAARSFGFAIIADGAIGIADAVAAPFDELPGEDDSEKALQLIEKCIAARGLKVKSYGMQLPVAYSPAFEEEAIPDADLYAAFGTAANPAFELVQVAALNEVTDGMSRVVGAELGANQHASMGIVVKVAGKKLQTDYEPLLERQIQTFMNYASGVVHGGREDRVFIRISNAAAAQGITLAALGKMLCARFHQDFAAVEKVEVSFITEPDAFAEWQAKARRIHEARKEHLASLADNQADVFFVCTNCRAFAPNNVSVISPERVSPCGQCTWLDAKAGYEMGWTTVRRPIQPGKLIDARKGIWEGLNEYARTASHGRVNEVALYSVTQSPMSACADFECIVMAIPEANGVMVLAHDDTSPTPAGVSVEMFASIAAGEQIPGVEGIGKSYLLSPKFISADGGFKRVVWMSSILKETMAVELKAVCAREGEPDLMEKVADEREVTSVPGLVRWLREHNHPALRMERMY